jgi:hypothetical protein
MNAKTVFCFDADDFQRVKEIEAFWHDRIQNQISAEDFQNKSMEELLPLLKNIEVTDINENAGINAIDITVVFIGKRTFENEKCLSVIKESFREGKAFLAVYLNNSEDVKKSGKEILGKNPFDLFYFEYKTGATTFNAGPTMLPGKLKRRLTLKEIKAKPDFIKTYDYIKDSGEQNLAAWIEEEYKRKMDFFAECSKLKENEWDAALKITYKENIVGFFLYYHWLTYSKKNETAPSDSET